MTPETLAQLHRAAFLHERPWTADEFVDLCASPFVALHVRNHGFALSRTVADETELLTIAVDPRHQRCGLGRALTTAWLQESTAKIAFLEVASDNVAARALYVALGFQNAGQRAAYYARKGAPAADAIVMRRALPLG